MWSDRQAAPTPKLIWCCNCKSYGKNLVWKVTEVTDEGVCTHCGHYAFKETPEELSRLAALSSKSKIVKRLSLEKKRAGDK